MRRVRFVFLSTVISRYSECSTLLWRLPAGPWLAIKHCSVTVNQVACLSKGNPQYFFWSFLESSIEMLLVGRILLIGIFRNRSIGLFESRRGNGSAQFLTGGRAEPE